MEPKTVVKTNELTKEIEKLDDNLKLVEVLHRHGNIKIGNELIYGEVYVESENVKDEILDIAVKYLVEKKHAAQKELDNLPKEDSDINTLNKGMVNLEYRVDAILKHLNISLVPQPDGSMIAKYKRG